MTGAGGGDETGGDVAMPVSTKGVMTSPTMPLIVNVSASDSTANTKSFS